MRKLGRGEAIVPVLETIVEVVAVGSALVVIGAGALGILSGSA